jgi:hypothetical protein
VTRATFAIAPTPTVATSGSTGTLLAIDRQVLVLVEDAAPQEWTWSGDVESVTALRDGLGVMSNPSTARYAAAVRTNESLVVPALVQGGGANRPADHQRPLEAASSARNGATRPSSERLDA